MAVLHSPLMGNGSSTSDSLPFPPPAGSSPLLAHNLSVGVHGTSAHRAPDNAHQQIIKRLLALEGDTVIEDPRSGSWVEVPQVRLTRWMPGVQHATMLHTAAKPCFVTAWAIEACLQQNKPNNCAAGCLQSCIAVLSVLYMALAAEHQVPGWLLAGWCPAGPLLD